MSRGWPYGAAYANRARRRREVARDPAADATKAAVLSAGLRTVVEDEPARRGVVDLLTRWLLDRAGYVHCPPVTCTGSPESAAASGRPLPGPGGGDDA